MFGKIFFFCFNPYFFNRFSQLCLSLNNIRQLTILIMTHLSGFVSKSIPIIKNQTYIEITRKVKYIHYQMAVVLIALVAMSTVSSMQEDFIKSGYRESGNDQVEELRAITKPSTKLYTTLLLYYY